MKYYITSTIMLAIILVISVSLALSKDTKTTSPMSKAAVSSISSKADIFSKAAVSSTAASLALVAATPSVTITAPVPETKAPVPETPKPAVKPAPVQVEVKQPELTPQAAPAPAETKQTYYNGEGEEYKPIQVTPAATKKGFSFI